MTDGAPAIPTRGMSFEDGEVEEEIVSRPSDDSQLSTNTESAMRTRPVIRRSKTGESRVRPLPTARGVNRAASSIDPRRGMMNQRAMSTRDFGSGARAGRGLGMARTNGGGRGMAAKSMSSRLLGAASDNVFSRMASTRALFMDEPEEDPSIILYMGREIKVEDHFDDEWIEDALDEEAGLKGNTDDGSRMSQSSRSFQDGSKRRGRNTGTNDDSYQNMSYRKDSDEEGSEVEVDMDDMSKDRSLNTDATKRRGRRLNSMMMSAKRRSHSSEPGPKRVPHGPPKQRGVGRCKTFDGRQTSEILPRRRKPKTRSARNTVCRQREDLNEQFQHFLSKTGGVTPTGNHPYQDGQYFSIEGVRRRPTRMPTSRKKVEQFRRLEYTAEDIQDVLCEDEETFQRLKRVLTKKGAITNGVLQQRLHIFLKKAKDRHSKLMQQKREEEGENGEDEEADDAINMQAIASDWGVSMMDMFAHSMRKLTADTDSSPSATSTQPESGSEPTFQRRALPRMQAIQQKRMQSQKASRTLTSFEEGEDEESTNHDASQHLDTSTKHSLSPVRRKPADGPASPVKSPTKASAAPRLNSDSKAEDMGNEVMDAGSNHLEPKELPVTRKPMELDLTTDFEETVPIAKELPVTREPMKLDLTSNFNETAAVAKGLHATRDPVELDLTQNLNDAPIEPKCLDDQLPAAQQPMKLDLTQNFKDTPIEPKCLDDELSASQRPMKLDLTQNFKGTPIEPKCLDDELSASQRPMKLDMRQSFQDLPVQPKCLDDELSASQRPMKLDLRQSFQDLPIQPKCLDDELSASQRPMKLDLNQDFKSELQPKCLDDDKNGDKPIKLDLAGQDKLLFTPKNLDDQPKKSDAPSTKDGTGKMDDGSKMDSSRVRRRHRPSRIRNHSGVSRSSSSGLSGMSRRSNSSGSKSATPTRLRSRRSKSQEDPPPLNMEIKCLDDPTPTPASTSRNNNGSHTGNGSSGKPAPPGLLVGWNH